MKQYQNDVVLSLIVLAVALMPMLVFAGEGGHRYDLVARASEVDSAASEHPDIGFTFVEPRSGNPADLEHAVVDTRVPREGRLVIWLMAYNSDLFDRLASYGLHAIQVHYANRWFGTLEPTVRDSGDVLGKIRLEAATGEDSSPLVTIPKADGMRERARQFLIWLEKENPEGDWAQFLTTDRSGLRWEKVTLAGSSHGSTTAARFALHQAVDRVVMFAGPRDNTETWQGGPSATSSNRFFGFSHVLDTGWQRDHYCRSWQLLGMQEYGPVINVERKLFPFENSRRLISDCDMGGDSRRAHSGVLPNKKASKKADGTFRHEQVWRYLFMHPVTNVGQAVLPDTDCSMQRTFSTAASREERKLEGWRVLIDRSLLAEHAEATEQATRLLTKQLQEIVQVVPAAAVEKLRAVPLYLSPAYKGFPPQAAYHPSVEWLRDYGRDPEMAKAVEFTNILIFKDETKRMPNFVLHELAHAYHDREIVDGYENNIVSECFERAKASGKYESVQRLDAKGQRTMDRAYAMTNVQEYFAEATEAFFSRNDFFPFYREELQQHDPHACRMLKQLWGLEPRRP